MNEKIRTLSALLVLATAMTAVALPFDEVDLASMDDAADAAAARPIVTVGTGTPGIVDVSCDNATIANVLRQFRLATKANIINPDTTNLARRVSVELKRVPWLDALRSILNSRGFRLEERGNIFYVEEAFNKIITRSYVLNHASAEELADLFNGYSLKSEETVTKDGKTKEKIKSVESRFSALGGKVRASAFPNANVLVLSGIEADLQECESIIKAIDRAATQVYIEARFLELSSNAKHELGMKWDSMAKVGLTSSGNKLSNDISVDSRDGSTLDTLFKHVGSLPATYAGRYTGTLSASDFSLFLSAFEEVGGLQIFSNPKVIISNGKEAVIDMTTKFPNVKISANYQGEVSSRLQLSAELEEIQGDKEKGLFAGSVFFSYGITLSVKPRISPEGSISVKITPSISEIDGFYEVNTSDADAPPVGKYPIIKMKSIDTDFTMKDGTTAVIGGLSRTTETDVDNGIPYLRKIPWIGPHLFGWKSREKVQMEIIICVTIGIANPETLPEDAGLPKNAVLGREYVEGRRLEPGDREDAASDAYRIDTRPIEKQNPPESERDSETESSDEVVDLEDEAPVVEQPATKPESEPTPNPDPEPTQEPTQEPENNTAGDTRNRRH